MLARVDHGAVSAAHIAGRAMARRSDGVTTHDDRMHVTAASTDGRPQVPERPSLSATMYKRASA